MSFNPILEKQDLRDRMSALRQALPPEEVEKRSFEVARRVLELEEVADAEGVCIYASIGKEVQTGFLKRSFLQSKKKVAIPDWEGWKQGSEIRAVRIFGREDVLREGRIVPQPRCGRDRAVLIDEIELFLVPGLAFDRSGNRLGMGGGYFDRLLKLASPKATVLGLAYEFQLVRNLPSEKHDVPVNQVVTQAAVRTCRDFQ